MSGCYCILGTQRVAAEGVSGDLTHSLAQVPKALAKCYGVAANPDICALKISRSKVKSMPGIVVPLNESIANADSRILRPYTMPQRFLVVGVEGTQSPPRLIPRSNHLSSIRMNDAEE